MLYVDFEWIQGVGLGFEIISKQDAGEQGGGWYLIIDLVILRILIDKD